MKKNNFSVLGMLTMVLAFVFVIFVVYTLNSCSQSLLRNTSWKQTGGTFLGSTDFTIDFGEDNFIASNYSIVVKGRFNIYSGANNYVFSLSLDYDSEQKLKDGLYNGYTIYCTISGNSMEIKVPRNSIENEFAAFRKVGAGN
jgi:hypothetical protein